MTATRCRPPTLRDLSTELTFEVADFCSGSKPEIAPPEQHVRSVWTPRHVRLVPIGGISTLQTAARWARAYFGSRR